MRTVSQPSLEQAGPSQTTRVYGLAHVLEPGVPRHVSDPPFAFSLTKLHGDHVYENGASAAGDMFVLGGHIGTHLDAVCHISRHGRIHGDRDVAGAQSVTGGIAVGSVEQMEPLVLRAHLVDCPQLLGRPLVPEDGIGAAELEAWFRDREGPAAGEAVLLRTGWDAYWSDHATFLGTERGLPGLTLSGADWLVERRVAAVGADTAALEQVPSAGLAVQVRLLVDGGIPLLKALRLAELAGDEVHTFLLVVAPLPVKGGTGSPVQPVAIAGGSVARV